MIRSTKTTFNFSNPGKLNTINSFINEYRRVVSLFVDMLWTMDNIKSLLPKELTSNINTWLSARAIQCAGKQASGIVRGCQKKQSKRLFQINKFKSQRMYKKARKLQAIYNNTKLSKPNIEIIQPELDSRFVEIDLENETSFDGWLNLTSLGNSLKIVLPFKKHKHFNKLLEKGKLKGGVRISNDDVTFMFEIKDVKVRSEGKTVGIDIGQTTTLTCSDGQSIEKDNHNHTYKSICEKLSRKKKGSKNFNKAEKHRSNYIRWAINKLNLNGVGKVNLERIKNLRRGKRSSRLLSHWNYAELVERLESKLYEAGVQINKVNPTYTSQRCFVCGWTRKKNRKGKQFKCDKCSYECDADLNGSLNISLDLPVIGKEERLQHKNRKGFYWNVVSKEPIVSYVQKNLVLDEIT